MASGGESPTSGARGGMGEASASKKTPSLKRTRSAQLGWLTQCYSKILAAVGEINNEEEVNELYHELNSLWDRYETAHSNFMVEASLSESKLDKMNKKHEDNRKNFHQVRVEEQRCPT